MKARFSTVLFAIIWFTCHLQAQEVITTVGGSAKNKTVQISYTIGEAIISTIGNQQNTFTQCFHQSILIVSGVEEENPFTLKIKGYPNPTSGGPS
jgi:hypothetical protein